MKKTIIALFAVCSIGVATPVAPSFSPVSSGMVGISNASAAKVSKKSKKEKKKNTKKRIKKLNQLGVPESLQEFGDNLSLREMGNIIAAWIVQVWVETGQLPATITNDPPDWLMLNVNGSCVSGPCDRWEEE